MENSKIGKFWAIGKEIIFWEWKHWFGELKYLYISWTDFYCFIHFTVFYDKSILQFSLNCLVKNYRQNTWWLADIEWKAWKVVYLYDLLNTEVIYSTFCDGMYTSFSLKLAVLLSKFCYCILLRQFLQSSYYNYWHNLTSINVAITAICCNFNPFSCHLCEFVSKTQLLTWLFFLCFICCIFGMYF
jgi:hypothetical protein